MSNIKELESKFKVYFFISRFYVFSNIWIIYLLNKNLTLVDAATLDIVFYLSVFIFEVPTGVVADKMGRKASVMIANLIISFGLIIFLFSNTLIWFAIAYLIWGIGLTFVSGAEEAWIYDELKLESTHEDYTQYYQEFYGKMMSLGWISTAIAGMIGGLISEIDLVYPLIINVFLYLITVIYVKYIPERSKPDNTGRKQFSHLKTAASHLFKPIIFGFAIIFVLLGSIFMTLIFWMQPFLYASSINLWEIGIILSAAMLILALGNHLSGAISKLLGKFSLILPLILFVLGLNIMANGRVSIAIIFYFAVGFFKGIIDPILNSQINERLDHETRATSLSIIGLAVTIISLFIEYFSAVLIEKTSYYVFFKYSSLVILAICFPLALLLFPALRRVQDTKVIPEVPLIYKHME